LTISVSQNTLKTDSTSGNKHYSWYFNCVIPGLLPVEILTSWLWF